MAAAQAAKPLATVSSVARVGAFLCLGLTNSMAEQIDEVAKSYDLHPFAVADPATGKKQPKVQPYPQHSFSVIWALMYSKPSNNKLLELIDKWD